MLITRRTVLRGLLAAPIVCGSGVLMPVKRLIEPSVARLVPINLLWGDWIAIRFISSPPMIMGGSLQVSA